MRCLLIEKEDELEFPELRESALKAIGTFVASGDEKIVDRIAEGVGSIIESQIAGHRQATILLFSTLY